MKLRIRGNSIRLRLTKTDVHNLCESGLIEETTAFINNTFTYSLETNQAEEISAELSDNKLTVFIPGLLIEGWNENDTVGFSRGMNINDNDELRIIVEKDFKCNEETTEDQSDNYENPSKEC